MTNDIDSTDWSKYPPGRVEGLKYFYKGPTSDEDRPCSDEELKMLCIKWDCKVDMKIDNFLFWLMKKTFERDYGGNRELFVANMPKMARALRRKGMNKYRAYQEVYAEKNRQYLAHCAEWRLLDLRRLRWLDKLGALCSTCSWDDTEEEEESDSETESENLFKDKDNDTMNFTSNSSVMTVIDRLTFRFNSYPETESFDMDIEYVGREEEIGDLTVDDIADVNTQLFAPVRTSTQKE